MFLFGESWLDICFFLLFLSPGEKLAASPFSAELGSPFRLFRLSGSPIPGPTFWCVFEGFSKNFSTFGKCPCSRVPECFRFLVALVDCSLVGALGIDHPGTSKRDIERRRDRDHRVRTT